jgi:hypothetical protein
MNKNKTIAKITTIPKEESINGAINLGVEIGNTKYMIKSANNIISKGFFMDNDFKLMFIFILVFGKIPL